MEIFVCKLTGDFMSGINLLQSRDITVKEPPRFYSYIGYGKSDIKNRVECNLAKKYVIILEKLQKTLDTSILSAVRLNVKVTVE